MHLVCSCYTDISRCTVNKTLNPLSCKKNRFSFQKALTTLGFNQERRHFPRMDRNTTNVSVRLLYNLTSCTEMGHIRCLDLSDCDSFIFWGCPKSKEDARHPQNNAAMKVRTGEGADCAQRDWLCTYSPNCREIFTQGRRQLERHRV